MPRTFFFACPRTIRERVGLPLRGSWDSSTDVQTQKSSEALFGVDPGGRDNPALGTQAAASSSSWLNKYRPVKKENQKYKNSKHSSGIKYQVQGTRYQVIYTMCVLCVYLPRFKPPIFSPPTPRLTPPPTNANTLPFTTTPPHHHRQIFSQKQILAPSFLS